MRDFPGYDAATLPGYLNRSHAVADWIARWELKIRTMWAVFWTEENLPYELQLVRRDHG